MDRRSSLAGGTAVPPAPPTCCLGASSGARGGSDSITLPAVEAPGSPGGEVAIRPPGRVVLLDFFATWCAPRKPQTANLRAVRWRFDRRDVFVVSITQESDVGAVRAYWERYDGTWPVAMGPGLEATRTYDVAGVPTILVLAPDGTGVARHVGLSGEERIVSAVGEALAD